MATKPAVEPLPAFGQLPRLLPFAVYNVQQVDELPTRYYDPPTGSSGDPLDRAEGMLAAVGARVEHGGNVASYSARRDQITMPAPEQFVSLEHYYAISLHEHVHWTGHPVRLNRNRSRIERQYAFEELVAELGAAFLCALLALRRKIRHAGYISIWARRLKRQPEAIYWAARYAEEAVGYLEELARSGDEGKSR